MLGIFHFNHKFRVAKIVQDLVDRSKRVQIGRNIVDLEALPYMNMLYRPNALVRRLTFHCLSSPYFFNTCSTRTCIWSKISDFSREPRLFRGSRVQIGRNIVDLEALPYMNELYRPNRSVWRQFFMFRGFAFSLIFLYSYVRYSTRKFQNLMVWSILPGQCYWKHRNMSTWKLYVMD